MTFLECKIPPAVLFAADAVLMGVIYKYLPILSYSLPLRKQLLWIFFAAGVLIGLAGLAAFWKRRTTIDPHRPEKASAIVRYGIYKFSRNPMYLGLLVILTGIAIYFANLINILLLIGFVLYMNRFQIIPEERAMAKKFGDDFSDYKKSVRRWI